VVTLLVVDKIEDLLSYNVIRFRNGLGLTQDELAEKAGLSLRMIQKMEYKQAWPSPTTIESVAKALQIESCELFSPRKPKPSPTMESLLLALTQLQKENDELKAKCEKAKSADGALARAIAGSIINRNKPKKKGDAG